MKHRRVQFNLLLLILGWGAIGPPLIGPLRESFQASAGLSRAELGLWIMVMGLAGSVIGLAMGILMRRTVRTTFVRAGLVAACVGCALLAARSPSPGLPLVLLAAGWFVLCIAKPVTMTSNAIFVDLWEASPHTGLIAFHASNMLGKVAAPVAVLLLGTAVRPTALIFAFLFGLLALESLYWPKRSVRHLVNLERSHDRGTGLRLPKDPMVWVLALQFAFIAGSEAGATAILGSFVARLRPVPVGWIGAGQWPSVVIAVMLLGALAGRVAFAVLSLRLKEKAIVTLCLLCGLFAAPAALSPLARVYLPSLFLTGVCFSATWPAFFALVARAYPADRTFLSFATATSTAFGIWGCVYLSSVIGNVDSRLPYAFLASVAVMALFAGFLYLTPPGRKVCAGRPSHGAP